MKRESLSIITVKTLLAVVIFTGIGTIIIGGVYLIGKQKNDKLNKILPAICKNNFDCPLQMKCKNYICVDVGCLEEGESLPGVINPKYTNHMATKCCEGLKRITVSKYYDTDCNIQMYPVGGSISICSNCGNGICESWENRCNCPEDCGDKVNTADWQTYRNEEIGFEFEHPSNLKLTGVYKQKNSPFETDVYFKVPIREYKDDEVNREDLAMGFRNRAYYEDNYEEEPNFQEIVMEARRRAFIDVLAEEKNIIVSNINAIEFKYKDNLSNIPDDEVIAYEVYIQKSDGKIFSIGAAIKLSKKEIYLPVLNRIISSFKFIEKDEISDWQTYRNEEYGFEVKYPQNWVPSKSEKYEVLSSDRERILIVFVTDGKYKVISGEFDATNYALTAEEINFSIFIEDNNIGLSIEDWLAKNGVNDIVWEPDDQEIKIANNFYLDRVQGKINRGSHGSVYFTKDDKIIILEIFFSLEYPDFRNPLNSKNNDCSDVEKIEKFNKILSTFKFIEKDEISDWKTYQNEEYGFEFEYPSYMEIKTKKEEIENKFLGDVNLIMMSDNWHNGYSIELSLRAMENNNELSFKDALNSHFSFPNLNFVETKTENNVKVLKPGEQTEAYWEKYGPMGSGLEYNFWFVRNQNYIFGIHKAQDYQSENLTELSDQILSSFKFIEK